MAPVALLAAMVPYVIWPQPHTQWWGMGVLSLLQHMREYVAWLLPTCGTAATHMWHGCYHYVTMWLVGTADVAAGCNLHEGTASDTMRNDVAAITRCCYCCHQIRCDVAATAAYMTWLLQLRA